MSGVPDDFAKRADAFVAALLEFSAQLKPLIQQLERMASSDGLTMRDGVSTPIIIDPEDRPDV